MDEMDATMIHQQSGFPSIHYFERCPKEIRPATEAPNNPVHCGQDQALGGKGVAMTLGSSGGSLTTKWIPVIEILRRLLISEERQCIASSCAGGRIDDKPTLDALTTEDARNNFLEI